MGESSSRGLLLNELLQLEVLVRKRQQMQMGEAAFQALEHCRDLVQITDHSFKIQVIIHHELIIAIFLLFRFNVVVVVRYCSMPTRLVKKYWDTVEKTWWTRQYMT